MGTNLYLSVDNHDLTLDATGQLRMTVEQSEQVSQNLTTRLKFYEGEWWLNTALGIPYLTDILVKHPDLNLVRSLLVDSIVNTKGVQELLEFEGNFDRKLRQYVASFTALLTDGTTLTRDITL